MKNIAVPTTKKQLRNFIGLNNYYRDMWQHRSKILTPLLNMTSKQAQWNWSKEYQKAYDKIKKLVSRETLLFYPNVNKQFEIYINTSKLQQGSVIGQNGKLIAFYSGKINHAQFNYSITEREFLLLWKL